MRTILLIAAVLALAVGGVSAQGKGKSGDHHNKKEKPYDHNNDNARGINDFARYNPEAARIILSRQFDGVGFNLSFMLSNLNNDWDNVAAALAMSIITGQSPDKVTSVFRKYESGGWGSVAKQLGIKPGSAEFHRLKQFMSDNDKFWNSLDKDTDPAKVSITINLGR